MRLRRQPGRDWITLRRQPRPLRKQRNSSRKCPALSGRTNLQPLEKSDILAETLCRMRVSSRLRCISAGSTPSCGNAGSRGVIHSDCLTCSLNTSRISCILHKLLSYGKCCCYIIRVYQRDAFIKRTWVWACPQRYPPQQQLTEVYVKEYQGVIRRCQTA